MIGTRLANAGTGHHPASRGNASHQCSRLRWIALTYLMTSENGATHSGQETLTFRLRAINGPLRQASKGHSRPLGTARLAKNQAQTPRVQTVPKLTVRVRFPSPAPRAKCVAIHTIGRYFPSGSGPLGGRNQHSCHYACH